MTSSPVATRPAWVDRDWYRGQAAQDVLSTVINRHTHRRKQFGLLERPSIPPQLNIEECAYKLFLSGKTGVGKSCTVAKMAGADIPTFHYETPGIQVSTVYWPARIVQEDRLVMFRLEFWDAGDLAMKKYDHILPACKDKSDAVIFVFSYVDRTSFDDLPQQMARVVAPADNLTTLVVGTKFDQFAKSEVTLRDIKEFEAVYRLPILRTKNIPVYHPSGSRSELTETAPILNVVCEYLWQRDLEQQASDAEAVPTYV